MMASLIGSGTLGRCPDLRIIVPHGGGTIPFLAPRMAHFVGMTPHQPAGTGINEMMAQMQSVFYDLAASTHPGALHSLRALVPPTQLLSGFDFPFMPAPSIGSAIADLKATKLLSAQDQTALESRNALRLLPGVATRLRPLNAGRFRMTEKSDAKYT
jgi:predicted TIM-barrel fold metal-dependent hydrolase